MAADKAAELVMRCFHARTAAHVFHLGTKSYAEHKALNDFYDDIVGLVDTFAETYQGLYGLLPLNGTAYAPGMNPKAMLAGLLGWIQANRYDAAAKTDTALQNIIDEIVALIAQTSYKLKFLA